MTRGKIQASPASGSFVDGLLAGQPDWQEALCAQVDPDLMFPDRGGSTRDAKALCRSCLDRAVCLEYALSNGERFGIWGGTSERDRIRLGRKRSTKSVDHGLPGEATRVRNWHMSDQGRENVLESQRQRRARERRAREDVA